MYFYDIGYQGQDEGEYWQLAHDCEYSKDELASLIHEAVVAIIPEECYIKGKPYIHDIATLVHKIAPWLVENKGFRRLEFTAEWQCDSGDSIIMPEDTDNKELIELSKALRAAGYTWRDDSHYRWEIEKGAITEKELQEIWEGYDAKKGEVK